MRLLLITVMLLIGTRTISAQFTEAQLMRPTHDGASPFVFSDYADLNGDGLKDLIMLDCWLPAMASGEYEDPIFFDTSYLYFEHFPMDFDNDGDIDLISRIAQNPSVAGMSLLYLRNDGNENMTVDLFDFANLISVGDADADGDQDLFAVKDSTIVCYLNDNGFETDEVLQLDQIEEDTNYSYPAVEDINQDGINDFVYLSLSESSNSGATEKDLNIWALVSEPDQNYLKRNLYNTTVASSVFMSTTDPPLIGDFDADGEADIIFYIDTQYHFLTTYGGEQLELTASVTESNYKSIKANFGNGDRLITYRTPSTQQKLGIHRIIGDEFVSNMVDLNLFGPVLTAIDFHGTGADQLVVSDDLSCSIQFFEVSEDEQNVSATSIYEAPVCRNTNLNVWDKDGDEKADLLLWSSQFGNLAAYENSGELPISTVGIRQLLPTGLDLKVLNNRLFRVPYGAQQQHVISELKAGENQLIGETDTLFRLNELSIFECLLDNFLPNGEAVAIFAENGILSAVSLDGDSSVIASIPIGSNIGVYRCQSFDYGNDGDADLFYFHGNYGPKSTVYMLENDQGSFLEPRGFDFDEQLKLAAPIYANDDELLDFFVETETGTIQIRRQLTDGTFTMSQLISGTASSAQPYFFDADLDGDLDIISSWNAVIPTTQLMINQGDGTFTESVFPIDDALWSRFISVDLAGDAYPELVLLNAHPSYFVRIYSNDLGTYFPSSNQVQNDQSISLKLFPNPSNDQLNIDGLDEAAPYSLFDIMGRLQSSGLLDPQYPKLDTSDLESGFYNLKIEKQGQSIHISFLKN